MATKRENDFDNVVVKGIEYIRSPQFKAHIFAGKDPLEVAARTADRGDLLNHKIRRGDGKDKNRPTTSLADMAQWWGPTADTQFAKLVETQKAVVANGAKIDALTAAFTGAIAALTSGQPFDQEKFLASVQERTQAGVLAGFNELLQGVPATVGLSIQAPLELVEKPPMPSVTEEPKAV